jgi:hypothetical protein
LRHTALAAIDDPGRDRLAVLQGDALPSWLSGFENVELAGKPWILFTISGRVPSEW